MARARKPRKLSDEERAALEKAAAQADAKFSRKFSATPTGKPTAEPKAGESVAEVVARPGDVAELKVLYPNGSQTLHAEMYTRRGGSSRRTLAVQRPRRWTRSLYAPNRIGRE